MDNEKDQFTPETLATRNKFYQALESLQTTQSLVEALEEEFNNEGEVVKEIKNALFGIKSSYFELTRAFDNYRMILFRAYQNKMKEGKNEEKV